MILVATVLPSCDFLDQSLFVWNTPIETLGGQHTKFGFRHVEPTSVLRRVVPLEPLDEPAGLLGGTLLLNASMASAESIQAVETTEAPLPGGHYSQAMVANGFIFVAGQLPIKPGSRNEIPAGIDAQTRQALSNVEAILHAANSGLDRVVSVTVYVTDIAN